MKTYKILILSIASLAVLAILPQILPSQFLIYTMRGMLFAVTALALNLLFRYAGILSFGQALFFGIGAYVAAISYFHFKLTSFELMLILSIISSAVIGFLVGAVALLRDKIYFALLTIGFGQLFWSIYYKSYTWTRADDGLPLPATALQIFGVNWFDHGYDVAAIIKGPLYYYIAAFFVLSVVAFHVLTKSPFGLMLQAVRDDKTRVTFVGSSAYKLRLMAFIIAGVFTGISGTFAGVLTGHVNPEFGYWTTSSEIVAMLMLGGYNYFSGPIIGGLAFTFLKNYLAAELVYWQLFLGLLIMALAIGFTGGIVGAAHSLLFSIRAVIRGREAVKTWRQVS